MLNNQEPITWGPEKVTPAEIEASGSKAITLALRSVAGAGRLQSVSCSQFTQFTFVKVN